MKKFAFAADAVVTALMAIAAAVLLWKLTASPAPYAPVPPAATVDIRTHGLSTNIAAAHTRGTRTAKVALIEHADFECPFCARHAQGGTLAQIKDAYIDTGRVIYAFRHFPLHKSHPNAIRAAQVSECAGIQGQFWQMHSYLFENTSDLGSATLDRAPGRLGLDPDTFGTCVTEPHSRRVDSDIREARRLGVIATPTFFVGIVDVLGNVSLETQINGAQPFETLREAIEAVLESAK
jgi:protein-disulfide isomerase